MTFVLDAGAFVAIERGDRVLAALFIDEARRGDMPRTHGGVVAQVWRGGARQVALSKALKSVDVIPLGKGLARQTGHLLGSAGTSDVVDAALICIAQDGDVVVTSDESDIVRLVDAAGADVSTFAV